MIVELILEYTKEVRPFRARTLSDSVTLLTMGVLFVASGLMTYKYTINSPFVCFNDLNPSGEKFQEYSSNYAWTHGSIPMSSLKGGLPETMAQWKQLYQSTGILYYQWVPVILFGMFFALLLCRHMWEQVCSTNTTYNLNTLLADCARTSYRDEAMVKKLAERMCSMIHKNHGGSSLFSEVRRCIQKKMRWLGFSRRFGSWIFANFVINKVTLILLSLALSATISAIFKIDFSYFINVWTTGTIANEIFPRSVIAFVPNVVGVGARNHFIVHCVTSVNLINEKLFPILMLLFLVLSFVHCMSLALWIIKVGSRIYKRTFVDNYLTRTNQHIERKKLEIFIQEFLQWDGVFLLMILDENCDPWLVRELLTEIWNLHLSNELESIEDSPESG